MRETLRAPTCYGCPHDYSHLDAIPQKKFGVMLHCGEHYCTGGKRARRFKRSDPKVRVPEWCPKRKNPCELRVYALKSTDEWRLHTMLNQGLGGTISPSAHRYALRFEGNTELSPREFWRRLEEEPVSELLQVPVELYEVLEIDDGLKPVHFYRTEGGFEIVSSFDGAAARKNHLSKKPSRARSTGAKGE